MQIPCVYLPGPAPAVTVANNKNFKDEYKIKERVKKIINIRRHMSILVAPELHYFQELLNW